MKRSFTISCRTCFAGTLLIAGVACTKNLRPASAPVKAAGTSAASSTAGIKGLNWADSADNYSSGNVVPSGLNASDSYAATQIKANNILAAFQQQGANTIRIPINPPTVSGTWWSGYTGAIDAATAKGMNVILGYWEASSSGDGLVDDTTDFWNMWQTVVNKYGATPNIYFEVFNEPHGYSVSALTNLYAEWLGKYPSVPAGRVLLDGAGYATDVNDVGADSRLTGCPLSYHNYTWFNNSLTTSADWEGAVQTISYPTRTVMTEFGSPMTTGDNYLGAPGTNRDIAYLQGITNQLRSSGIGGVYWPGLRIGDTYSLLTLSGTSLTVNNSSGLSRLQYAWGNTTIAQPYGSFSSGNWYEIANRNSGDVLDVNGQSTAAGARIIQWSYWGGNNQQWSLAALDSGYYTVNNRNSSLLLDVAGASKVSGDSVIQWTADGGLNQQWQVIDIGFGYYQIVNHNSGLSLDVNGASTANGAGIIQWPVNGGSNQQWQIIEL
jgi:endoglucanase